MSAQPDRVLRWGSDTFKVLAEQAGAGVPGVVMRESLALYREPPAPPDWAAAVGGVRAATPAELPPGYGHGLRFAVPLVEMPVHLPWLVARVGELGGQFEYRRVASLAELAEPAGPAGDDADVVVNCAGLAARELVPDPSVVSGARPDRPGRQPRAHRFGARRAASRRAGLRAPAHGGLHSRRHPGGGRVGHRGRSGRRSRDRRALRRPRSGVARRGRVGAGGGAAAGAPRGPARGGGAVPRRHGSCTTTGTGVRASR